MKLARRLARMLTPKGDAPAILMYHRVASPPVDPWGLAVSPENFRSQLQALKRRRTTLSMDDFAARLRKGTLPADAVALTFDDGYLDNLEQAKPILEEEGVPATILVTTGWLDSQNLFWWDALTQMILLNREPISGRLVIAGEEIVFDIGSADDWEPRSTWRSWDPPRSEREKLYVELWTKLQRLDEAAREGHVRELAAVLGDVTAGDADRVMTRDELAGLSSDFVDVGAHAVTHQPLTSMPPGARKREIAEGRDDCAAVVGKPMRGFAYPHGDLDEETRDIVRDLGFDWACTTESRSVPRAADVLALPRIMAHDVPGDDLLRHIERESA